MNTVKKIIPVSITREKYLEFLEKSSSLSQEYGLYFYGFDGGLGVAEIENGFYISNDGDIDFDEKNKRYKEKRIDIDFWKKIDEKKGIEVEVIPIKPF